MTIPNIRSLDCGTYILIYISYPNPLLIDPILFVVCQFVYSSPSLSIRIYLYNYMSLHIHLFKFNYLRFLVSGPHSATHSHPLTSRCDRLMAPSLSFDWDEPESDEENQRYK